MKKSLLLLLTVVSLITFSCSKDAKINRRLNGEWSVITVDNTPLEVGETITFSFDKEDKLTGTGVISYGYTGVNVSINFTYSVASEKLILVTSDGDSDMYTVMKYENSLMELMDSDGDIWVLNPKK
jgi:hypothetical protein